MVPIPKEAKWKNNFPHKINYILKEFCEPIARSRSEIMLEFLTRSCLHRRTKRGRWKIKRKRTKPISESPPAPISIINLGKWSCLKKRCSYNHCTRRKAGLACIDLSFACHESEVLHNNGQEENKHFDQEDCITCKKFRTILISNRKVSDKPIRNF